MPIRSRPLNPNMLNTDAESVRSSSKMIAAKKFNYSSVYISNNSDLSNFSFFGNPDSQIDTRFSSTNLYYGRVDFDGNAIVPKLSSLSGFGTKQSTKFAVNFVAQAFNDFRANFLSERSGRNFLKIRSSNYRDLAPFRAYISPDTKHSKELEDMFTDSLHPFLLKTENAVKITDFHSFLEVFMSKFFADHMLADLELPLTRSGYVISNKCSPLTSGMVIDIAGSDFNNDNEKFNDWVNDPAYKVIRSGAANFGFLIDKHAPWRFVANLNSPNLLGYIQGKGLLQDKATPSRLKSNGQPFQAGDVFDQFFDKAYFNDITVLKQTLLNFYTKFFVTSSYFSAPSVTACGIGRDLIETPKLNTNKILRKSYSMDQLEKDYDDFYWLNQYMVIRLLEGGVRLNEERLFKQFEKVGQIKKYLGYNAALTYVNDYANVLSRNINSRSTVQSVSKYAFSKTANPQVTGFSKNIGY